MWKSFIKSIVIVVAFVLAGCETMPEQQSVAQPAMPTGAKATYSRAISAVKAGQTKKAIQLFTGLTREYPDFAPGFTNLGLLYLKQENLADAEHAFNQAILLNPADAVAYNHLGVVLRQRGQFEQASQAYEKALGINAAYAGAHLNLGILNDLYLQDLSKALRHYQRYQALTGESDKQVAKWIVDLQRRVQASKNTGDRQG